MRSVPTKSSETPVRTTGQWCPEDSQCSVGMLAATELVPELSLTRIDP